jgi:hypothetical protein
MDRGNVSANVGKVPSFWVKWNNGIFEKSKARPMPGHDIGEL